LAKEILRKKETKVKGVRLCRSNVEVQSSDTVPLKTGRSGKKGAWKKKALVFWGRIRDVSGHPINLAGEDLSNKKEVGIKKKASHAKESFSL